MSPNLDQDDSHNLDQTARHDTPPGQKWTEYDVAKFALAIWQRHHGTLTEERQAEFLLMPELKRLVNASGPSIARAISSFSLIMEFVPEALFLEIQALSDHTTPQGPSRAVGHELKATAPTKPKNKASKRNTKQNSKKQPPKQPNNKSAPPPQAGVAHRASGWSASTRSMPSQADDTERCSQCDARISAAAAALHDCS